MKILLALLLASAAQGQVIIDRWCGLNNSVPAAVISDCEVQDSLNVEANRTGTGLKKRDGYSVAIDFSTRGAILSSFIFQNSDGNDQIMAVDADGYLMRSQNFGDPTDISTITKGGLLHCSDNEGKAYCFSDQNDPPFIYDGSTIDDKTDDGGGYPNGKFNAFTQDRQLVAGASDFLNRLYISKSGDFDNFVTGTDDIDAWTEDIGRNGDEITYIGVLSGRVIIGKPRSIGGFNLSDQFNSEFFTISDTVGIENFGAAVIRDGLMYFKGSDNHFYVTDGAPGSISRLSNKVQREVAAVLSGKNRVDVQTLKSDWDAGDLFVSGGGAPARSDIVFGSVMMATVTAVDTSSVNFNDGTLTDLSLSDPHGDLTLASTTLKDNWNDGNFTANPAWTPVPSENWQIGASALRADKSGSELYTPSTISTGSWTVAVWMSDVGTKGKMKLFSDSLDFTTGDGYALEWSFPSSVSSMKVEIVRYPGTTSVCSTTVSRSQGIFYTWTINRDKNGVFSVIDEDGTEILSCTDATHNTASHIILAADFSASPTNLPVRFDDLSVVSYSTTGVFTSRYYDTTISSPVGGPITVSTTLPAGADIDYYVRFSTANDGGGFNAYTQVENGDKLSWGRRYGQLVSIFNTDYASQTPRISDITLAAATTGQYTTACIEPGSGISAWGVLDVAGDFPGNSYMDINIQTGNDCNSLGGFTNISTGVAPGVAVKAALKYRIEFQVTSATEEARVDSIITRWTEGSLAPPSYAAYWDEGIYFSYSTGTTVNNKVSKIDLRNPGIWPFDIGMNAPVTYAGYLYFGDTADGKLHKFSDPNPDAAPTSDDGSTIKAYARTRSFHDGDPFTESKWQRISVVAKKESGGDVLTRWRVDGGDVANGSFTFNLSTGANTARHNYSIPQGQLGTFFDLEFYDDSVEPYEILGAKIDSIPQPWRPLPQ